MLYLTRFFLEPEKVTCIKAKKLNFIPSSDGLHTLHNIKVQVENHFIRLTQERIIYQNYQKKIAARSKTPTLRL